MSLGEEGDRYADCGTAGLATNVTTSVRFSIRVSEAADGTSMTVGARFHQDQTQNFKTQTVDCESLGTLEARVEKEVAAQTPRE